MQTTESKEAQSREYQASLEDLRLRSTAELRDFGRELAAAGEELEKSRNSARNSEGKASKLQVLGAHMRNAYCYCLSLSSPFLFESISLSLLL